jgi:uncharacterized membrane protein YfcA
MENNPYFEHMLQSKPYPNDAPTTPLTTIPFSSLNPQPKYITSSAEGGVHYFRPAQTYWLYFLYTLMIAIMFFLTTLSLSAALAVENHKTRPAARNITVTETATTTMVSSTCGFLLGTGGLGGGETITTKPPKSTISETSTVRVTVTADLGKVVVS